jgi:hypothetical protein
MKMIRLLIVFFSISTFNACDILENQEISAISSYTIKSGQSFGFCLGKCYSEMTIKGQNVELLVKERSLSGGADQEIKYNYNEPIPANTTLAIEKSLDIEKFFALKEVYGCPDCADGGSEWIEVITDKDKSHKVTFEYGKTIPEINDLIVNLRQERQRLIEKYSKN